MRNSLLAFLAGVLLLPVALLLLVLSGRWPLRADVVPSTFETWLANRITDASVRRQATPLTNPIAATPDEFGRNPPRKPDWQLFWIVKHGVRYTAMGGWDGQIPDDRLWRAVTFLSRLDSLPAAVDSAWHAPPPE